MRGARDGCRRGVASRHGAEVLTAAAGASGSQVVAITGSGHGAGPRRLPVRRTFTSWTSRLAGALALVLALGWAAPPAGAAENVGGSKPLSAQAAAKIAKAQPRAFQAATP